jgi:chromosome segregation protein
MSTAYIKKLELQGFKSFAERTKILFHPGITAVIGPNGTGKSNIVDGLLWSLGGQRPRSVRGEKIDDIIFNGNTKKSPMGMADATITLNNEPEELVINHRAYRSGEGEYRLDGKAVRLKDIQDELWKRNIGDKEYFVIEQGSIGQFVTSKPQEKRYLLEAAAGTAFYKDKRRQAENKLEDTELNLTRLEDIIEEVGHAKNSLQRQAHAATRYRKLRERIRELTGFHFRRRLAQVEKRQAEIVEEFNRVAAREKDGAAVASAADKDVQLRRKELWDLERSLKQEQENLYGLKSSLAKMEADKDRETKRIEFLGERKTRASADLEDLRREVETLDREAAEVEASQKALADELAANEKAVEETDRANRGLKDRIAGLAQSLENLRQDYVLKISAATELKNEQSKLDKEAELIARQEDKLAERLARERARLEESLRQLKLFAESRELLAGERTETQAKAEAARARREAQVKTVSGLEAAVASLKEKRDGLAIHLEALNKLIASERSGVPEDDVPGALGLLADFIQADAETTPLLDILWKEEARARLVQAQEFLDLLETREIKGSFVLLPPSQFAESVPPAATDPAALGLIKERLLTDPKLGSSLSRLEDAVIAPDLKTAVGLWLRYAGCNFVTLGGDLLLASGFLRPSAKAGGFFSLSQEARRLEEDLRRIGAELGPAEADLELKLKERHSLDHDLVRHSDRLGELDRLIQDEERKDVLIRSEQEKLAGDVGLLEKEGSILTADREALAPRREELVRKAADAQARVDASQKAVEEAEAADIQSRRDLARAEQGFFELKAAGDVLREKISGLKRQAQGLVQRREAAQAKIASIDAEILAGEQEKDRIKAHLQEILSRTSTLEADQRDKESLAVRAEGRQAELRKELEELEAKLAAVREEQEKVKDERVKREVARAEIDRDLVNLEENCWQELRKGLQEIRAEISEESLGGEEIETELEEAKEDLQRYKAVNLMAEEEYTAQKERYDFLVKQRDDLRQSIVSTKEAIQKIDEESRSMFLTALAEVNKNFQQVFGILFNGGTAEVKLTEPENPLESGVEIVAQPPGKKVQSLGLLSGGEKSLTSLGFLFALFRYKPAPFCVLDEVDAALDDVNLGRFLELMKKVKTETQFIIVTHNYKTMEVADFIYGTTMSEPNVTSVYSMKLDKKEPVPEGKA